MRKYLEDKQENGRRRGLFQTTMSKQTTIYFYRSCYNYSLGGLELYIVWPQVSNCWTDRCVPPQLV